tara:strand:- start:1906 stop:2118 length:213 start_codon:yes stop_codon:yes gene_type:complete
MKGHLVETQTLNFKEASKVIGCSARYLRELDKRGEAPPYFKLGNRKRFMKDTLTEWLKSKEIPPVNEAME